MFQILIARFKIHDSEFIIIGGVSFFLVWLANAIIKDRMQKKAKLSYTDSAPAHIKIKPRSKLMKYTIWFTNFIAFWALVFLITYLFY